MKKNKVKYIDDGRTIANMNVEGMPWYNPAKSDAASGASESSDASQPADPLSVKETLYVAGGVLKASLLVALVFIVVFTIFILFAVFVWLK